ncbi:hypothetical protein PTI98_006141 [Pleurotus ostreatus]|nr:hypothetical protein PTI98_006141 [Pleurotus ostreatus]
MEVYLGTGVEKGCSVGIAAWPWNWASYGITFFLRAHEFQDYGIYPRGETGGQWAHGEQLSGAPSAAHEVHESRYITASEVEIRPEREMQWTWKDFDRN